MSKSFPFRTTLITLATVVVVSILNYTLNVLTRVDSPMMLFFIGITACAALGGMRQGLLATFLSLLTIVFVFMNISTVATQPSWALRCLIFICSGTFISIVCGQLSSSKEKLQLNEARLRKIFDSNMVGLTFSRDDGRILEANEYFLRIVGVSRSEFVSDQLNWKQFTPPEYAVLSQKASADTSQVGFAEPFEKEYIRRDGTRIPVLVAAAHVSEDVRVAFILDLSEIKKAHSEVTEAKETLEKRVIERTKELSASQGFLDSIIENLPNMVFVKDADNLKFVRFNRAGEQLLGRGRHELVGKSDADFFPPAQAEHFIAKDRAVLTGRVVVDIPEEPIQTSLGETKFLHTKKIPIFGVNGEPEFLLGISEDITERRKQETQRLELVQAQAARAEAERTSERMRELVDAANEASRAKSAFMANISHEIRTPLGAMLGFAELALEDENLGTEHVQKLKTIERNGRQLLSIVNEILDLSKVESQHIQIINEPFKLGKLIEEVIELLSLKASEKNIGLNVKFECDREVSLSADPNRLRQMIINIVGNAIKFTQTGEVAVTVALKNPEAKTSTLSITVEDSGIGLTEDQASRLFRPFAQADESMTRRFGGTGLGLFLSRRLAQLMGGDVSLVRSEIGRGSCFRIEIAVEHPEISATRVSETTSSPTKTKDSSALRVLIVDDAADNRLLLKTYLDRMRISSSSASNGREGVELALKDNFDVILLDVQMPEMDGLQAVQELRERGYTKPIVALTAHAMKGDRERCLDAGFDEYLQKPVDRKLLESTVIRIAQKV